MREQLERKNQKESCGSGMNATRRRRGGNRPGGKCGRIDGMGKGSLVRVECLHWSTLCELLVGVMGIVSWRTGVSYPTYE